eukprot:TRINITY_DN16139_c0_g1_i1.p1 TRINITY_DN16139_c0_g1~~TRINITY_DN16139_c0_g1_i1.p1  ORF type:complete len:757 (+),score=233.22 TRINITY_DN16139_c0_g1_i1:54-2273(+)
MGDYEALLELKRRTPDWSQVKLVRFERNIYVEHARTRKRKQSEVDKFRAERGISAECAGGELPKPVLAFRESGLPDYILSELTEEGFENPTPIQAQGWPVILSGHDLVAVAATGSGKTLGYVLPGIVHVMAQPLLERGEGPIAVTLCPTRELAMQVHEQAERYAQPCRVRTACLYGGVPRLPQQVALQRGVEMVVATPGRLIDLIDCGAANLARCTLWVLDEADKMLNMGFEPFIRKVGVMVRPDRQTLLFTATMPRALQGVVNDLVPKATVIRIGVVDEELALNTEVQQRVHVVAEEGKRTALLEVLRGLLREKEQGAQRVIVYCATKPAAEALAEDLRGEGIGALGIHGDKSQREREAVLGAFRDGSLPVMVSTDMTSRGIDVKGVSAVVNYDFPHTMAEYVHRIGRTARAGEAGVAHSFFTRGSYALAPALVGLLRDAQQPVPPQLLAMLPQGAQGPQPRKRPRSPSAEARAEQPAQRRREGTPDEPTKPQPRPSSRDPSPVLLLRNLVGPGEVDEDLEGDVRAECERHGTVLTVSVYEQQRWASLSRVPPELAVRVFVRFADAASAQRCWRVMSGRQFGGRTVLAGFYELARFERGDLAPDETLDPPAPRCLLLRNMVLPHEVDDDLIPDTVSELSNFGAVQACQVHVVPDDPAYDHLSKEERVRVFVRFASCDGACNALVNLDGRMFAQKEISAILYDDLRWDAGDFLPDEAAEPELPLRCFISTTQLPGEPPL